MTQTNLLDRAKQGDPQAIATLMNRSLQPRGITADVELQGNCLRVALEAEQVPNRQALTAFVQNGIGNLGIQSLQSIKVMGRQIGASVPAWIHEIILDVPTDQAATDPAIAGVLPAPDVDLLPPTLLPMRPIPPPAPPFHPAIVPLAGDDDPSVADILTDPSENALTNASTNVSESQFEPLDLESLDLESLDLDDLELEEFDDEAIAPLSNADFGFPEDSELEEAIANDFGVSNSRSREIFGDRRDNAFTNSLDDLGLGALDDEPNAAEPAQGAIASDLTQLDQTPVNLNAPEEFNVGDELSDHTPIPENPQPASESIDTADLLASLEFEDGLDLQELALTDELMLASDSTIPQFSLDPTSASPAPIDFERDLNFEDDLAIGNETSTDPLSELDFEDAFNEDAFNLDSDLDVNTLSDTFPNEFGDESDQVLLDPLAALDLDEQLGFEPTDRVTGEAAPNLLAELELEDEFQFEANLDEANLGEDLLSQASWNLDEEPVSDSWLTENPDIEISNPESDFDSWSLDNTDAEIPSAEIPTDSLSPLAFTDQFSTDQFSTDPLDLTDEPSSSLLVSSPTYPDYALDSDPMATIDGDDAVSGAATLPKSLPDPLGEAELPANPSTVESSSFLDFSDLQDDLGQDDLGTVELVESPDDDLPPELLVDDIAMPDDALTDSYPSFSDLGSDDTGNDSATRTSYSDEDSPTRAEDVMLDWMTEPTVDSSLNAFPENNEPEQEETWRQGLVQEPTLEGFSAIAQPDFYLDTAPPDSSAEPDQDDRTLELVDSSRPSIESFEPFPDLPVPNVQASSVDAAIPLPLPNQRVESPYALAEQEPGVEHEPRVEQEDSDWAWANIQTEPDTVPSPGYFQSDEFTSADRPLLIDDADPSALSLEPTTDQNLDWEADAAVDSPSDASSGAPNGLSSSVLLFLTGWIALLIGYSLWTNLTAPPPAPPQPEIQQPLEVPPASPSVAPVPPPVPPAEQIAPPPQPLPGEAVPPVPPAN